MHWEVPCIVCFPFVNDKDGALSGFGETVNDNICSPTTMLFGKMKGCLNPRDSWMNQDECISKYSFRGSWMNPMVLL